VIQGSDGRVRTARAGDIAQLLTLWELLYDDVDPSYTNAWQGNAGEWLARSVEDHEGSRIAVMVIDAKLVSTAIGTLDVGVPNPHCPTGRAVRLANVVTLPEYRGLGYATALVLDVIAWARIVQADRVDLGATPDGQRIYEKLGFSVASAPRMKLAL
jgi:GNAT superfamily N-acetyltransferase